TRGRSISQSRTWTKSDPSGSIAKSGPTIWPNTGSNRANCPKKIRPWESGPSAGNDPPATHDGGSRLAHNGAGLADEVAATDSTVVPVAATSMLDADEPETNDAELTRL